MIRVDRGKVLGRSAPLPPISNEPREAPAVNELREEVKGNTLDTRLNINTATAEELASIKGIGDEVAAAIIAARPWGSVDELTRVSGIGKAKLAKLAEYLTV